MDVDGVQAKKSKSSVPGRRGGGAGGNARRVQGKVMGPRAAKLTSVSYSSNSGAGEMTSGRGGGASWSQGGVVLLRACVLRIGLSMVTIGWEAQAGMTWLLIE